MFGVVCWICAFVGLGYKRFVWFLLFVVLVLVGFLGLCWYVCFWCCFGCLVVLVSCFFCSIVVVFKVGR